MLGRQSVALCQGYIAILKNAGGIGYRLAPCLFRRDALGLFEDEDGAGDVAVAQQGSHFLNEAIHLAQRDGIKGLGRQPQSQKTSDCQQNSFHIIGGFS